MEKRLHIAGISGSLRKNSLNTALLRAVPDFLPEDAGFSIIGIGDLPLYNSDREADAPVPEVEAFRTRLREADALIIASPEYNYSVPGVLKNALDWASRGQDSPLINKPVAIMGASPGLLGTVRMQMHLRQVFLYNNMRTVNKPEVIVGQARTKFTVDGVLSDERTRESVRQLVVSLIEETERATAKFEV